MFPFFCSFNQVQHFRMRLYEMMYLTDTDEPPEKKPAEWKKITAGYLNEQVCTCT